MDTYPPSEYPKLYLEPKEYYLNKIEVFRNLVSFALITCFLVVLISWSMGNSANEEMLVFICFALQSLPILILAALSTKHVQNMRKAHTTTQRSASLHPRKLFDFISPFLVSIAAVLFIVFLITYLIVHDFEIYKEQSIITFIGSILLQGYFIGMLFWKLNSRKQNPLVSESDRINEIKTVAKIAVYASIAMSVYLTTATVMDEFKFLDVLDPIVMSVYLQLIVIFGIGTEIRSIKINQLDFESYKSSEAITPSTI